jgi:hypothetical protein
MHVESFSDEASQVSYSSDVKEEATQSAKAKDLTKPIPK